MKLYRIILPVGDIDYAARFYAKLFSDSGMRVSPGRHYFDLEGTILACYDAKADGDDESPLWKPHNNQYLYFAVDDLEEIFATIKDLEPSQLDEKIDTMPWGERLFYANDPWGNPICFVDRRTTFTGNEE